MVHLKFYFINLIDRWMLIQIILCCLMNPSDKSRRWCLAFPLHRRTASGLCAAQAHAGMHTLYLLWNGRRSHGGVGGVGGADMGTRAKLRSRDLASSRWALWGIHCSITAGRGSGEVVGREIGGGDGAEVGKEHAKTSAPLNREGQCGLRSASPLTPCIYRLRVEIFGPPYFFYGARHFTTSHIRPKLNENR
jgi:hypothetical protein